MVAVLQLPPQHANTTQAYQEQAVVRRCQRRAVMRRAAGTVRALPPLAEAGARTGQPGR